MIAPTRNQVIRRAVFPAPRDAATVILLREAPRDENCAFEVFLLRRRKTASFMGGSFVFPGGAADEGEEDLRATAARELFEEAGVLLTPAELSREQLSAMRARVLAGEKLSSLLAGEGVALDLEQLAYFSHWITPSVERKRFSARFFVAALPPGQRPSFDDQETVDEAWLSPRAALARAAELALPPPQVRTLLELSELGTIDEVRTLTARRATAPHPILPRMAPLSSGGFTLLLPWDPEYLSAGTGDLAAMPSDHLLAAGPSRFILEDNTWKNVAAPGSTTAG